MGHRERAVAWALLGVALGAHGQAAPSPPPAPAPAAAAAPDKSASASAAAMERARRMAEGPMRVILEAGKGRKRPVEPDASTAAAAPVPARATAAVAVASPAATGAPAALAARAPAPQVAPAAAAAPATSISPAPAVAPAPAGAAQAAAAPAPAPVAAPAPAVASGSGIETRLTLESSALQNRVAVPVTDTLQRAGTVAPVAVEAPRVAAPPLAPARPRLLNMPEPDLPQRVLDELGRNASVLVDLTIQPDGRVSALAVLPPAPRQMQRLLEASMRDWLFAPLPAERVHRIELVFNNN